MRGPGKRWHDHRVVAVRGGPGGRGITAVRGAGGGCWQWHNCRVVVR